MILINAALASIVSPFGETIRLCAASKTRSVEEIEEATKAGVSILGENRVQELLERFPPNFLSQLRRRYGVSLRFIGALQSNKVKFVASVVDSVDSVDSPKLAQKLNASRDPSLPPLEILLQYNPLDEASKGGVRSMQDLEALAASVSTLPNLALRGLMCMAPLEGGSEAAIRAFTLCRTAYDSLRTSGYALKTLSMGMSGDYKEAIRCGSNMVRIGTALFGSRA